MTTTRFPGVAASAIRRSSRNRSGVISIPPRAPKAAFSTIRLIQLVHNLHLHREVGNHEQLCDPGPGGNHVSPRIQIPAEVPKGQLDLAPVVGVDHADAVHKLDPVQRDSRPDHHQPDITLRNSNLYTSSCQNHLPGFQKQIFCHSQVQPGRPNRLPHRSKIWVLNFDLQLHLFASYKPRSYRLHEPNRPEGIRRTHHTCHDPYPGCGSKTPSLHSPRAPPSVSCVVFCP